MLDAVPDAAVPDAAVPDAAVPDAAVPDAAVPDAAVSDAPPSMTPIVIGTTSLPATTVGQVYAQPVQASGGDGALRWSTPPGSLPPGLALDPATGLISGVPTLEGTYTFEVDVNDAGGSPTASRTLQLVVSALPATVLTVDPPSATVIAGGTLPLVATVEGGSAAGVVWTVTGPGSVSPGSGPSTTYTAPSRGSGATPVGATVVATLGVTSVNVPLLVAGGTCGPAAAFQDATFVDADWSATLHPASNASGIAFSAGQDISGTGNPGPFRSETHTWANGLVVIDHQKVSATWDPATSGAVESLDVSFDVATLDSAGGNIRYEALLVQSGVAYFTALNVLTHSRPWATTAAVGLHPSDFGLVTGGPTHPDLSASGAPFTLGYAVLNSLTGRGTTKSSGLDNWRVTLHCADEVVARVTAGDGQSAAAGTPLAQPLEVLVTARGPAGGQPSPLAGATVAFTTPDGGSASPASAVTDARGRVATTWTLGPAAGGQALRVVVRDGGGTEVAATTAAATATAH